MTKEKRYLFNFSALKCTKYYFRNMRLVGALKSFSIILDMM